MGFVRIKENCALGDGMFTDGSDPHGAAETAGAILELTRSQRHIRSIAQLRYSVRLIA